VQVSSKRVLLVEDNGRLRRALSRALATHGYDVNSCSSVSAARSALSEFAPDAMLLDVVLPDGSASDVLGAASALGFSVPAIAFSGRAEPLQAFELAQLGLYAFLPKPVDADKVLATLERALSEPVVIDSALKRTVGVRSIREVERRVRRTMVDEAMARSGGNRQVAAQLLNVSRQLLQHILRKRR